ncbi:immunoglobulin-like domain-containing protein [Bifidobacterium pseudolongum]|uniref:immunoglobulin-like domain-containing protein n=1 Tax=Bifidobacterium pseudolongum TaxID=1694 RepID=UPI0010D84254|nr:immunoglobulin-like domain-containing protein [Bifidobacterium pseudolongum]RYP99275.1 hypothetical protein PG22511B_1408 [Bifidobacterium pseudolongum subsp. globosum]
MNQTDKTAPVITGVYDTYSTIDQPYDWMDGVKATDDVDGGITDRIQIPKNTLDIHKLGTYAIQYYVEDNAQNKTWSGRKVTVTNTTLDSLISYSVTTKVGTAPTLPVYAKATWSDGNVFGQLGFRIVVTNFPHLWRCCSAVWSASGRGMGYLVMSACWLR